MHTPRIARSLLALALLLVSAPTGEAAPHATILVTGTVTTSAGAPLFGANVTLEAERISVGTDERGRFRFHAPARLRGTTAAVRARSFGYLPQVRGVLLDRDSVVADFVLAPDVNRLSQVIVTGATGATEVRRLPFSVSKSAGAAGDPSIALRSPGAANALYGGGTARADRRDLSGEEYARIVDHEFRSPLVAPRSTFGVDVDRASYANVRRIVTVDGQHPPADAVRLEEFVNYFPYDYAAPTGPHPFAVHTEVARAPWAPEHLLVRIGLQARTIDLETAPASNLVFLLDVSGSMSPPDKLPLLKEALRLLVAQLREQDRVAIVVYAGSEGLALPSTPGSDKAAILGVLDRLEAGGSTAGGAGIRLAYDVAQAHFIPGGNNRVILATDGDFNVGVTSNAELERMVERRRAEGTALTVLGFGAGNLKDHRMEMLADKGNGAYAYIDSPLEARKVLVQELGGTLFTVAKDVKVQVEFNPAVVAAYRQIGYENRALADEDFRDDRKDAGDIGAGHSVTALYEVIPVGTRSATRVRLPDALRYGQPAAARGAARELAHVRLRYKPPTDSVSVPLDVVVPARVTEASADFRFAQAVTAFGLALRGSAHRGDATPALALRLAEGALGEDAMGYRADFVRLVQAYQALPAREVARRER